MNEVNYTDLNSEIKFSLLSTSYISISNVIGMTKHLILIQIALAFPHIQDLITIDHENCDLSYQETDEIFGEVFSAKPHHDRDNPSIKTTTITELDVDVNYSISHYPPHLDRDILNL